MRERANKTFSIMYLCPTQYLTLFDLSLEMCKVENEAVLGPMRFLIALLSLFLNIQNQQKNYFQEKSAYLVCREEGHDLW